MDMSFSMRSFLCLWIMNDIHLEASLDCHFRSAFAEFTGQFRISHDTCRLIKLAGGCQDSAAFYHLCKKKKLTASGVGELYIVTGITDCVSRVDNLDKHM